MVDSLEKKKKKYDEIEDKCVALCQKDLSLKQVNLTPLKQSKKQPGVKQ